MSTTIKTYQVVAGNLAELKSRVGQLNKKAIKLGMSPITLTEGKATTKLEDAFGTDEYGDRNMVKREVVRIEVTIHGDSPVINGWEFVALLQHEDGGTIIKAIPGLPEGMLKGYRNATTACDHCKTNRRRNDTFVVRNVETTALKQVGRNCLRDFLGHANPHALASMAELLMLAGEACEMGCGEEGFGGSGGSSAFGMNSFLTWTIAAIRAGGWLSRTKAREMGREGSATADRVVAELCRKQGPEIIKGRLPEDAVEAERLFKFVADHFESQDPEKLNDYEHNLRVVVVSNYVAFKSAGIAASLIGYARKLESSEIERKLVASGVRKHVGTLGARETFVLTVAAINAVDTQYGTVRYMNFRDAAGNRLVWKASGSTNYITLANLDGDLECPYAKIGMTLEVTGTVEEHKLDRRDGITPETWLKRCVLAEVGHAARAVEVKKKLAAEKRAAKKKKAAEGAGDASAATPTAVSA